MSTLMHKALSAVAPVVSVTGSIAVLRAAQLPFPPEWAAAALPQWAVFGALVYISTAFLLFVVSRVFGSADKNAPAQAKSQA
jgi:predicted membrane channel-forming protein YqfA (hemolysin III family)